MWGGIIFLKHNMFEITNCIQQNIIRFKLTPPCKKRMEEIVLIA